MTLTPQMQKRITEWLRILVAAPHQSFTVEFTNTKPTLAATYLRSKRTITIHLGHCDQIMDVVGLGIHELAHHVTMNLFRSNKNIKPHGKEYRSVISYIVADFNLYFSKTLKGRMVYLPRKPRHAPRFCKL
jgi:predicted SprT family Zn-dependent metalloprotease